MEIKNRQFTALEAILKTKNSLDALIGQELGAYNKETLKILNARQEKLEATVFVKWDYDKYLVDGIISCWDTEYQGEKIEGFGMTKIGEMWAYY